MPSFRRDIKRFTESGSYCVDVGFLYLESWLEDIGCPVNLDPDYQRGHCWTAVQSSRYVEFILRGGESAKTLLWNNPAWGHGKLGGGPRDILEIVDGKQRLHAVRSFLRGELPVFGHVLREWSDWRQYLGGHRAALRMNVNQLQTRAEVLQWYLDVNQGGTIHTDDEITRVRTLLQEELNGHSLY